MQNQGNTGMNPAATRKLINCCYGVFNARDTEAKPDCLDPGFVRHLGQGERRRGKKQFAKFPTHMHTCYHEQLTFIVVMSSAQFRLKGKYLSTDEGLSQASGQSYKLTVGAASWCPPVEMNRTQWVYAEIDMELLAHLRDTG